MKTLRIYITSDESQEFDLIDILTECKDYETRQWIAWLVDWVLKGEGRDGEECSAPIMEAPNYQAQLSYEELMHCARSVQDTEDGFFLAVRPHITQIPKLTTLESCTTIADLVIHAFAFFFWEVTSDNEALLLKLAQKFEKTEMHNEIMEGGSPIPYFC